MKRCYDTEIALLFYIVVKHVAWVPFQTIEVHLSYWAEPMNVSPCVPCREEALIVFLLCYCFLGSPFLSSGQM